MSAARDIRHQRMLDEGRGSYQTVLLVRFGAVVQAQRAVLAGEVGARASLRQALVDVAAAAELAAGGLPAPPVGEE